ncbi:hypothetical protein ACHAPU_000657 [Fusarium lateritium]
MKKSQEPAVRLMARQILRFAWFYDRGSGAAFSKKVTRTLEELAMALEPAFSLRESGDPIVDKWPAYWTTPTRALSIDLRWFDVYARRLIYGRFEPEDVPEPPKPFKPYKPSLVEIQIQKQKLDYARKVRESQRFLIQATPEDPLALGITITSAPGEPICDGEPQPLPGYLELPTMGDLPMFLAAEDAAAKGIRESPTPVGYCDRSTVDLITFD